MQKSVAQVRRAMGLDQYLFARLLHVHVSSVYRWEAQKRPSVEGLTRGLLDTLANCNTRQLAELGSKLQRPLAEHVAWLQVMRLVVTTLW